MPPANAAELKIFGSRVTKVIVGELGPQFEKATGFKPVVVADVAAVMKRRIEAGEPFDLAVLVDFQIDDLIKSGKLLADSRADIMSSGIGVAVKRGAPKPDIGTVEAFKQTLLKAKSVTYLKEGASTIHLRKLFVQLGIADAIKAKAVETDGEMVSELVAEGKVELGLIVIPNIMSVPGAELVGPLPDGDQFHRDVHGRRVGGVAEPAGGAGVDQAAQEPGSQAGHQGQGQRPGIGSQTARYRRSAAP